MPICFLLLTSLFSPVCGVGEDSPPALVITNVDVVDVESGELLRGRSLLIEDGVIVRLDPAEGFDVPEGAREIAGEGRTLIPGLFDMHVHLNEGQEERLALYLANGVTTVHSMHGGSYQLELRARVASGEVVGPRILSTGPTTARLGVHTVEQARAMVAEQAAAGFDAIKQYGDGQDTMPVETYLALIETAHEAGLRVMGHAPRNLPFSVVLECGQDSIDHMEEIVYTAEEFAPLLGPYVALQFGRREMQGAPETGSPVPDFARQLEDEIEGLAQDVRSTGMHVTPTLVTFGTIQDITSDDLLALLERDELRYVHPVERRAWQPDQARFRNGLWSTNLDFMSSYLERNHELQIALTGAFHRAGVPILAGTDSPFDLVVEGFSLHDELDLLARAGLSPLEVLRAATLRPARFLGLDTGSIAVGKRADLALVDGDPLSDPDVLRRVAGLCLDGRWLTRAELDAPLTTLAERYEALELVVEELLARMEAGEVEQVVELYRTAPDDPTLASLVRDALNDAGYRLLRSDRAQDALALFATNTELFPRVSNTWDSLGEAYWVLERTEEAIAAYERALDVEPTNRNARDMLGRIRSSH